MVFVLDSESSDVVIWVANRRFVWVVSSHIYCCKSLYFILKRTLSATLWISPPGARTTHPTACPTGAILARHPVRVVRPTSLRLPSQRRVCSTRQCADLAKCIDRLPCSAVDSQQMFSHLSCRKLREIFDWTLDIWQFSSTFFSFQFKSVLE